jgi:sarcosine oxidase subunit beta
MRTSDVVIIGGGIVGAATAYYLARGGLLDIVLVERDFLASGSTGRCAGGIRQQWSTAPNVKLAMESVRIFEGLEQELGYRIEYFQNGYLILAFSEDELEQFRRNVQLQASLGLPVSLLTPREAQKVVPALNLENVLGATYCPTDGYANPFLVTQGYAEAARRLGVEILLRTEVVSAGTHPGGGFTVATNREAISCRAIVNAAGGYARRIAGMLGIDLPVLPYRREICVTEPVEHFLDPLVISFEHHLYFRQSETGGIIMGQGDPDEPSSHRVDSSLSFLHEIAGKATRFLPPLRKVKVIRQWAGLYEVTPDAQPVLGGVDGIPGYYQAVGFSGHGFMVAPKVAELLAELVLERSPSLPINDLRMNRFREKRWEEDRSVV